MKPLTIWGTQAYTIPHLHFLPGLPSTPTIDISQDTEHGLPLSINTVTKKFFGWLGGKNKTASNLRNDHDKPFHKGRSLARVS